MGVLMMKGFNKVQSGTIVFVLGSAFGVGCGLDTKEELGARIFSDERLSLNQNQSCASCHSRDTGGTGPDAALNALGAVYEGSVMGRFGNRKPPATAYAALAPVLDYDAEGGFLGGSFWDGRATGWRLGIPAAEQAQGPFLNPLEQALPDAAAVVRRVCSGPYGDLFRAVWSPEECRDIAAGYRAIALSIVAFEASDSVSPFSSKYDATLQGRAVLSPLEAEGLALFEGSARCAGCHVMSGSSAGPIFTDFRFDNLGIPKNPENPFYGMDSVFVDGVSPNPLGEDWIDPGLGGFLQTLSEDPSWRTLPYVPTAMLELSDQTLASLSTANYGKQRAPTLRNVDKRPSADFVKAYGHNGYFKSLKGIVHFYNTRDVLPQCDDATTEAEALAQDCWPPPEVIENLGTMGVGDLGLSDLQEDAIVAFLGTLSDGWR